MRDPRQTLYYDSTERKEKEGGEEEILRERQKEREKERREKDKDREREKERQKDRENKVRRIKKETKRLRRKNISEQN